MKEASGRNFCCVSEESHSPSKIKPYKPFVLHQALFIGAPELRSRANLLSFVPSMRQTLRQVKKLQVPARTRRMIGPDPGICVG